MTGVTAPNSNVPTPAQDMQTDANQLKGTSAQQLALQAAAITDSQQGWSKQMETLFDAEIQQYELANPNLPAGQLAALQDLQTQIANSPLSFTSSTTIDGATSGQATMVGDLQSTFVGDVFSALLNATGLANQTDPPPTQAQLDALYQMAGEIADANNSPPSYPAGSTPAMQQYINQLVQDLSTSNGPAISTDLQNLYQANCSYQGATPDSSLMTTFSGANGAGAQIASSNSAMLGYLSSYESQAALVGGLGSTSESDVYNALLNATGLATQTNPPPTQAQLAALQQIAQEIADGNSVPPTYPEGEDITNSGSLNSLIDQLVEDLSTTNGTAISSDLQALYEANCQNQGITPDPTLEATFTGTNGAGATIAGANTAMVNYTSFVPSGPSLTPPTPLTDQQQTDLNGLLSSDPNQVLQALENMTGIPVANLTSTQLKNLTALAAQIAGSNPPGLPGMNSEDPNAIATAIVYALFGLQPTPSGGIQFGTISSSGNTPPSIPIDEEQQQELESAIQTVASALANPGSVDSETLSSALATLANANPNASSDDVSDSMSMLEALTGNVSSLNTAEINYNNQVANNEAIQNNSLFLPAPPAGLNPFLQPSIMAILAPMLAMLMIIMNDIVTQSAKLDVNMQKLKLSMAVAMFEFSMMAAQADKQQLLDQASQTFNNALAEMITGTMSLSVQFLGSAAQGRAYNKAYGEAALEAEAASNEEDSAAQQAYQGGVAGRQASQEVQQIYQALSQALTQFTNAGKDFANYRLQVDAATQTFIKDLFNAIAQELSSLMSNVDSTQSKADDSGKSAVQQWEALCQLFKDLAQAAAQLKG